MPSDQPQEAKVSESAPRISPEARKKAIASIGAFRWGREWQLLDAAPEVVTRHREHEAAEFLTAIYPLLCGEEERLVKERDEQERGRFGAEDRECTKTEELNEQFERAEQAEQELERLRAELHVAEVGLEGAQTYIASADAEREQAEQELEQHREALRSSEAHVDQIEANHKAERKRRREVERRLSEVRADSKAAVANLSEAKRDRFLDGVLSVHRLLLAKLDSAPSTEPDCAIPRCGGSGQLLARPDVNGDCGQVDCPGCPDCTGNSPSGEPGDVERLEALARHIDSVYGWVATELRKIAARMKVERNLATRLSPEPGDVEQVKADPLADAMCGLTTYEVGGTERGGTDA